MRKLSILLVAVFFVQFTFAQINIEFENEVIHKGNIVSRLKNCSDLIVQKENGNIEIYNEKLELVKTITTLQHLANKNLDFVSKNFFTNTGQYEFILCDEDETDYRLYDENGTQLFWFGYYYPSDIYGDKTNVIPNSQKYICIGEDSFRVFSVSGGSSNINNVVANNETKENNSINNNNK